MILSEVPIQVRGDWGDAPLVDVHAVVISARGCGLRNAEMPHQDQCPSSIELLSGHDVPMVHAVDLPNGQARISVTPKGTYWAQIAYQFSHELGHVLSNSWGPNCIPRTPSHWLEEALVEAFSLSTVQKMGAQWSEEAPYDNWKAYAPTLASYASEEIERVKDMRATLLEGRSLSQFYQVHRGDLEHTTKLTNTIRVFVPELFHLFGEEPGSIGSVCARNRWPERTSLPLPQYLKRWANECVVLGSGDRLPRFVCRLLNLEL